MLTKSANTPHNHWRGMNVGSSHNPQPGQSPSSPVTSVLDTNLHCQLGDVAGSSPGTLAQDNSSNSQSGDLAGISPGTSAEENSFISQPGEVAGNAQDQGLDPES